MVVQDGVKPFIEIKNYIGIDWKTTSAIKRSRSNIRFITYSSGSAIDAIAYGIPTIAVDEGNFAYHVSSKQLEAVENPALASSEEIQQWFNDLSYCQWDRAEMAQGRAWTHIWPKIVDLCGMPEPTE